MPVTSATKADDAAMADTGTDTKTDDTGKKKSGPPPFFLVRSTHPLEHNKILFRSVSEKRARAFIERLSPRGSAIHLETPDGKFQSYETERQGEYGVDADAWSDFDPKSWIPPDEAEPPGESAWSDRNG